MTTLARLRELASRATKGPWFTLGTPWTPDSMNNLAVIADDPDPHKGKMVAECSLSMEWTDESDDPCIQEGRDAEYIASVDPQTVLQLLDTIEEMREALEQFRLGNEHAPGIAQQALAAFRAKWGEGEKV